jgi:hypothetical protein
MKALLVTVIGMAAIALAALFSGSGTAHADTSDMTFLGTLAMDGISSHTPSNEIALAHSVCTARQHGLSQLAVITIVYRYTPLSAYDAGFFVGAAESVYCPGYAADDSSNV